MDMAHPGQILLTRAIFDDARQFVRGHPSVGGWSDLPPVVWMIHGDYLFKGNDDPLALFEVGAEGIAPLSPPGDGAKGRKISESGSEQLNKSLPQPPSGHGPAAGFDRQVGGYLRVFNHPALYIVAFVPEGNDEIGVVIMGIVFHDMPQDRFAADFYHRLRTIFSLFHQACTESTGKNCNFHRVVTFF